MLSRKKRSAMNIEVDDSGGGWPTFQAAVMDPVVQKMEENEMTITEKAYVTGAMFPLSLTLSKYSCHLNLMPHDSHSVVKFQFLLNLALVLLSSKDMF